MDICIFISIRITTKFTGKYDELSSWYTKRILKLMMPFWVAAISLFGISYLMYLLIVEAGVYFAQNTMFDELMKWYGEKMFFTKAVFVGGMCICSGVLYYVANTDLLMNFLISKQILRNTGCFAVDYKRLFGLSWKMDRK